MINDPSILTLFPYLGYRVSWSLSRLQLISDRRRHKGIRSWKLRFFVVTKVKKWMIRFHPVGCIHLAGESWVAVDRSNCIYQMLQVYFSWICFMNRLKVVTQKTYFRWFRYAAFMDIQPYPLSNLSSKWTNNRNNLIPLFGLQGFLISFTLTTNFW